jgi:small-conductance mechanosensitive channel
MDLVQQGDKVTGSYPVYGGRIEGTAHGRILEGRWIEGPRSGGITFAMAPDGRTFMGRFDTGEWWTGGRVGGPSDAVTINQSGAREALRTFLDGGNAARAGALDQIGAAAAVVDFGPSGAAMVPGEKLAATRALFDVIDLTTLQLWNILGRRAEGPVLPLQLRQAGTGVQMQLTMVQHPDGRWFVAMPDKADLAAARHALLARSGGRPAAQDDYLLRRNPRDAMRSFTDGLDHWDQGGEAQAVAALDLSGFSDATRQYEGALAAQYMDEIMDRVGEVVPQEIPDDPTSRDPFLVLSHPAGDVVIAPPIAGAGGSQGWRFTADTVRRARDLYTAVQDMPLAVDNVVAPPRSPYFRAQPWVHDHLPALLARIGDIEAWQMVGALAILAASAVLGFVVGAVLLAVLRWVVGGRQIPAERQLRWPLRLALLFALYKLVSPALGLDERANRISVGVSGVLLAVAVMWGGWKLIDALGKGYLKRAEGSRTSFDAITVLLVLTALKIALLGGGLLFIASELSLPYGGVVAGLGIGGLAVAFASKETLSNVFGAALLAADRPFRRGDWISSGDVSGTVEHVGIRSTRIRTAGDSLVFVPNGKLADATVNNLGTRRVRLVEVKPLLAHGTTSEQVEAFVAGLPGVVAGVPRTLPNRAQAGVSNVAADGIEVGLTCYLDAPVYADELAAKTALMLGVLRLAEQLGITLGRREPALPLEAVEA